MQVSLSRRSWHAKYYKFVKGHYPTYDFKSLCPYFWTILSLVLLSPLILLWKLVKSLLNLTVKPIGKVIHYGVGRAVSKPYVRKEPSKFSKWYEKNDKSIGKWIGRVYFGCMVLMLLIIFVGSIIKLFQDKGAWMGIVYIFAFIGGITTGVASIWGIISFFETDTWMMIRGMVYSVKNKVCPMITWEDKRK